jgi:uncharacterized protein
MIHRLYILPRWAGGPADDWYPWLKNTLETASLGPAVRVETIEMPHWDGPEVEASVDHLLRVLPPELLTPDVALVGHSVGCQLR